MQAVKVDWVWKTFALASSHESAKKKARSRKTREERKALVESFITTYRSSNNGNFPSLNLTQKEVGGSFYTVRDIMKEIMQEHETSRTSVSALEDEAVNRSPYHEEELNLATLSSAGIHGIENERGSLVSDNIYQSIQNHARNSELSASSKSQEEGGEIENPFHLDASLSNSEGYISIELGPASDHKEQLPLCVGEFIGNSDEADKFVVLVEAAHTEEVEVEKIESSSPTIEDGDECVDLLISNENPDHLLSSDDKWTPEADEGVKEGQKLLDSQTVTQLNCEIPDEAHTSVGRNSILEQFEESGVELLSSPTIEDGDECVSLLISNENPDRLLSSHDKWSPEADEGAKEGQKLLDSQTVTQLKCEIPEEAHTSVGSNSILVQFEESGVGELRASDMITQREGQAENFDDNKNPNLEYDSSYNSGVGDNPSEDGTLDDVFAINGAIKASGPLVPAHVSAASAARLDCFPDGASVGTEELITQSVASVPVDVPTNDETYSTETISLPSNCKLEHTSLESLISENSDSTLSRTSENDSLDSQLNSLQEDEDTQVVTGRNDGSSSQNVDDPLFVPAIKSEVGASNSLKVADAISDGDVSSRKSLEDAMRRSADGSGAEFVDVSGNTSSITESFKTSSERKLVVRRKPVTNPLWAVMKAFLSVFIKFWTE